MQRLIEAACIIIMSIALTAVVYAAGSSVTFTPVDIYRNGALTKVSYLEVSWVTDDSTGTAAGATTADVNAWLAGKYIILGLTDPDASAAPDDNYDVDAYELAEAADTTGIEIMGNSLHGRDTANSEQAPPECTSASAGTQQCIRPLSDKYIYLKVSNAGNSKKGKTTFMLGQ